ncbi:Ubiquitin carboxyl-terminal hydrolase 36 [Schistosoma japonicum]|nr:Ubiquitin carboxyl-terminal hydrolase 36 [Schistosoma japonicum]
MKGEMCCKYNENSNSIIPPKTSTTIHDVRYTYIYIYGSPVLYKLYAIVNHEGYSCRSGHYVSFTLRHGQWLSLNDSFVSTTNPDHVLRQSPYLLFYEAIRSPTNGTIKPRTVTSTNEQSPSCNSVPKPNNSQLSPINDAFKQKQSVMKPSLPSHKSSNVIKQTDLPIATPISSSTSLASTPVACSNASTIPSVPKIVFNPKFSLSKINILSSPIVPSTSLSSSLTNNSVSLSSGFKDTINGDKNNSPNVTTSPPSTSSTSISLSSATVRELLYGKENSANLWTERPTPTDQSILSLSNSATITSKFIKNSTNKQIPNNCHNNSDNIATNHTKVPIISSKPPLVDTINLKENQRELINPLVDYSYEESDNDTKNALPTPNKRSRTSNNGSDSGFIWIPADNSEKLNKHHTDKFSSSSSYERKHHKKKHKKLIFACIHTHTSVMYALIVSYHKKKKYSSLVLNVQFSPFSFLYDTIVAIFILMKNDHANTSSIYPSSKIKFGMHCNLLHEKVNCVIHYCHRY